MIKRLYRIQCDYCDRSFEEVGVLARIVKKMRDSGWRVSVGFVGCTCPECVLRVTKRGTLRSARRR